MKKITLLLMMFVASLSLNAQVFSEDFQSETTIPATWNIITSHANPDSNWSLFVDPQSGDQYANILYSDIDPMDEWLITPSIDMTSLSDAVLTVDLLMSNTWMITEAGADLFIKVSTDGGTTWTDEWVEEDYAGTIADFEWFTLNLPLTSYVNETDVKIAFNYVGNDGAQVSIDNVIVQAPASAAPMAAINPDPADGATVNLFDTGETGTTGQPLLAYEFSFELPAGSEAASSYTFDLGDDATVALFNTTLSSPGITLQGLAMNSTYYWRITSTNTAGSTIGSVWSFTTSGTLGLEDIKAEKVLEHFVNNNTLTINAENAIDQVEIYNMLGQSVKTVNPAQNSANVDLGDLNSGMFISKVTIEGKTQTFKFVK
ncbi:T9SS-dependent choice-of-anchor J family protein [Psychroflexus halocasei]|uniref:Por secretion system C-terminal sorting domain-containing protein n=1 Tax=Psychroflexus halocasei TaxID=908615 RepID=A0A1H3XJM0_9FLAO|nr:choice-of-anchor J domain-containing protein [Psychroflexus halocasei]SDZ99460.1 Por secretion system C-terminal sorting domain-containing protein [Psychroflexus halocasei]